MKDLKIMAKKPSLPVAKAGGPVEASESNEHEAIERKYRAKEAADTLARASEIRKDKSLMRDVKGHIKSMVKACK